MAHAIIIKSMVDIRFEADNAPVRENFRGHGGGQWNFCEHEIVEVFAFEDVGEAEEG